MGRRHRAKLAKNPELQTQSNLSVISLSHRPRGTSLSAYESLIGNLYYGVRARRAHVFARLEGLVGKSLTLGGAHPADRGLFIIVGEVARDGGSGDFLAEETQAQ